MQGVPSNIPLWCQHMHLEETHLNQLEVLKLESKLSKNVHTFTNLLATMHWWMDKWCSSSTFDACNQTTSVTEYRVARAINLRCIDDDTCVKIQVLESSWHDFLNRSLVWPRGKSIYAHFQKFSSSNCIIWTQCSGSHQSARQGPTEKSCVSACTKQLVYFTSQLANRFVHIIGIVPLFFSGQKNRNGIFTTGFNKSIVGAHSACIPTGVRRFPVVVERTFAQTGKAWLKFDSASGRYESFCPYPSKPENNTVDFCDRPLKTKLVQWARHFIIIIIIYI